MPSKINISATKPVKPPAKKAGAKKKAGQQPVSRDKLDRLGTNAFVRRVADGESMSSIARSLAVGIARVAEWISADAERSARVKLARTRSAEAFADKAGQVLEDVGTGDYFGLAKSKELAHHYRWVSKTRDPRTYGDKQQVGGADDLPPVQHAITGELAVTPSEAYLRMLGKR